MPLRHSAEHHRMGNHPQFLAQTKENALRCSNTTRRLMLSFRVRAPSGQHTLKLESTTTKEELQAKLEFLCKIPPSQQKLLAGYPPVEIKSENNSNIGTFIKSGDTLIVEKLASTPTTSTSVTTPPASTISHSSTQPINPVVEGRIVRRVIPDDNSCLFNAVGYVLENHSRAKAAHLRYLVAKKVTEDPITFNEAVVGRADYANYIQQPNVWGGAVELAILAAHYRCEICAWDVINVRKNVFGEGSGYSNRVYVLYDGIHYDALALQLFDGASEELDVTVFTPNDATIENLCVQKIKEENAAGKFTDTAKFALLCTQCNTVLHGEQAATEHAMKTKHTKFVEKR